MRLQVRWRQWLTRALIGRWLANRHFYQLTVVDTEEADNPEARIAEDGRLAIELLVDFSLGVLNALLAAISFISILWVVGGAITIAGYTIPGYMVFACVDLLHDHDARDVSSRQASCEPRGEESCGGSAIPL